MILYYIIFLFLIWSCQNDKKVGYSNWHRSDSLAHVSKRLLEQNNLDSAYLVLEEALRLDPSNYEAYNNRAYLKNLWKRPQQEIIADFEKALEINPFYDVAIFSLANYYHSVRDWENTLKWTDKYYALKEHKETDSLISHIHLIREDAYKHLLEK